MWDFKMEWPVSLGLGPRLLIWCEMNRLCYASILSIEMYWSWLQPLTPKFGSLHMYSITSWSELHRWLASFGFQFDGQWKKRGTFLFQSGRATMRIETSSLWIAQTGSGTAEYSDPSWAVWYGWIRTVDSVIIFLDEQVVIAQVFNGIKGEQNETSNQFAQLLAESGRMIFA